MVLNKLVLYLRITFNSRLGRSGGLEERKKKQTLCVRALNDKKKFQYGNQGFVCFAHNVP